jgi:hypothetical protein
MSAFDPTLKAPLVKDLYALVYVSKAVSPYTLTDIDRLLQSSRQRNEAHGLSGVLLYDNGDFMQYIEGPASGLSAIYGKIAVSPMHHGIVELLREPLTTLRFPQWSMAFRSPGGFGMSDPAQQSDLLAARRPGETPNSVAEQMLERFWNRGRAAKAF